MTSLLQGSSSGSLRALHWTLSAGEESRRHALLRPLHSGGAATVFTLPKDPGSGAEEASEAILEVLNSNGKVKSVQHPKRKQRLQKSQLRLQTSKALQTPLHWLCAHDALETASGECLGGWPSRPLRPSASVSALARELMQQWPLAVLMPDAVGLWPFSHFGPEFCDSQTPHSPQRELLLTLLHSLAGLECRHPEVMMMLDPEELRSLRSLLQRTETSSCDGTSKVLEAFRRFTHGGRLGRESSVPRRVAALEAEEQRKDAWQWQMRGKELQHRLGALRRLSGQLRADKAPRSFTEALAEWHRKRESYEERLQQLRFELGRIPSQRPQGVTVTEVALNAVPDAAFWEAEGTLSRASDAELLIASLRRQRLGDGAGPGCGVRRALGAAVERLAVDLYEMESHFVYELVQNADDNCYDATGEDPWLRLELHRGSAGSFFVSVNNELGLTTQDVRAICDVNASSKRGRQGVTGHKGIGWKSCFQVSDCPYMLSGAFTFKFDVKSLGTLGYVTPTWVGEEELHSLPQLVWEAYYAGYTVTYLPLRQGTEDSVELAMAHLEEHLPCLLFLRRLKSLELCRGETVRLAVEDQGSDCVAVHRSTGVPFAVPSAVNGAAEAQSTWQFLVHRHRVLLEEKELILTLAFPDAATASKLPPQALYCLLPVRKLGFCFCLDGPFELIASRGDIHEGSRRNQALCEELPAAFAGALERHRSLAPRALELLGPPPPEPFWQRVHSSVLDQLQGTACVPLEEGGLEEPERCLLRPANGLAGDASRLIPSSLLWCACGKRWAAASNMGALEEMTFEHFVQVLRHRDPHSWPHGLCASWRSKDVAAKHFRCLFAYLGEVLETADVAAEVLQELWHLELLPAELLEDPDDPAAGVTESPRLYRLSDGVFAPRHQLGNVPCWAWKKLVDVKLLKILDEAFIGPESAELSFVQTVLVPLSPEVLYQQIREHFVLEVHPHEVLWALLALLQHLFLQEATPAEGWRAFGEVLRLPSLCGTSVRASRAVLPTFLGCALETAPLQRAARMATAACGRRAAEITACCAGGLPLGFSFLDTAYLTYGEPVAWEAFFVALGVRPLRPRRSVTRVVNVASVGRVPEAKKLPQVASSSKNAQIWAQRKVEQLSQAQLCDMLISVHPKQLFEDEVFVPFEAFEATGTLPKNLVATEWWQRVVEMPKEVLDYLRYRLEYAAAWLRELAVPIKGQRTRPVREHLLEQTDLARLCGGFLPVLRLPKGGGNHRVGEVKQCLLSLGLLGDATGANCLRCLKAISTTCQDVSLYVALYQRLEQHLETLEPEELAELKTLVFVPGHGMQTSGACAWSDSALMQLAEVPALCAHYERHGPGMEKYFTRILEHSDFRFDATQLLCALRRMVLRVNEGESAVPMCDGLDGMVEMVSEIYRLMSLHLKDQPSEVTLFRRSFGTERLLLLRLPGYAMPKRLRAEEAFWQLEPDLQKVASLQALALQQRFDEDLKPFFLAVGVHQEMTRPVLRQLLQRPQEVMSMMRWSGLNVGDVEDLGMLQTSSNFRPPDWHADDSADESTDAGTTTEGGGLEPDFQPPRHAGGPRPPPAIRSSEELERLEREEHQRRAEREERQQRHRERQQRNGEQGYFAHAGAGGATGATGATDATGATGAGAGEGPRRPSGAKREAEEETETTETESTLEDLHHLRVRLEELTSQSHTRQQESFELRTRWAQAEEDADRYMKILEQFYAAGESLRVVG